jgi:hypothetical protein
MVSKAQVEKALDLLITSDRYAKLVNEMTKMLEEWDRYPMRFERELSPLNVLLDVGLESRTVFEKLIKLSLSMRRQLPKQRRQDYQRELMAARRARMAKAIDLEELRHGSMTSEEKTKFTKAIQGRWAEARERFIKERGELTWQQRNDVTQEFWSGVDKKLDANIAYERKKKRGLD